MSRPASNAPTGGATGGLSAPRTLLPRMSALYERVKTVVDSRATADELLAWVESLERDRAAILDSPSCRALVSQVQRTLALHRRRAIDRATCERRLRRVLLNIQSWPRAPYVLRVYAPSSSRLSASLAQDLVGALDIFDRVRVEIVDRTPDWDTAGVVPHAELVREGQVIDRLVGVYGARQLAQFVRGNLRQRRS